MDYSVFYENITSWFVKKESRVKGLKVLNKILTYLYYGLYPVFVLYVFMTSGTQCIPYILVPGISFVLLSVFRKAYNAPRPYEKEHISPLIYKDTKGNSFPSRHVFSATVISMTVLQVFPLCGIVLLVLSAVEAAVRVIGGVHYPKDVVCGYMIGVLAGLVYAIV